MNFFSTRGVSESTEGFFEIVIGWGDGADHRGAGVASESVSQNESEFGVSVGHELFFGFGGVIGENFDNSAKSGQGLIDFGGLPESVFGVDSGFGDTLTAGKIDEMDDTVLDTGLGGWHLDFLNKIDWDDSVWAGGALIH